VDDKNLHVVGRWRRGAAPFSQKTALAEPHAWHFKVRCIDYIEAGGIAAKKHKRRINKRTFVRFLRVFAADSLIPSCGLLSNCARARSRDAILLAAPAGQKRIAQGKASRRATPWVGYAVFPSPERAAEARQKLKLARRLRAETTTNLPWLAGRLHMGSWSHVSNLLRSSKSAKSED
jgi:hypothetical protein